MHSEYEDILAIATTPPQWWDENGVPRFAPHHPRLCPDIYADEVALILISCQACGKEIPVQISYSSSDKLRAMIMEEWRAFRAREKPRTSEVTNRTLTDSVRSGQIHYGDPPYHTAARGADRGVFCHAGGTMNCWDLQVIEFWERRNHADWVRVSELEVELPDMKDPER